MDTFSALEPKPFEILEPAQARKQRMPVDAVMQILKEDDKPTVPGPVGSVKDMMIPARRAN